MVSISVVITCYNEEEYIGDSIESVISQTRYDLVDKVVVVDDGSEDGSREVIKEIVKREGKLEYIYQENEGLPGARNTGIERCDGDFFALQDGDDIWREDKIEVQAEVLKKYPRVGLLYSDFYLFGAGRQKRMSPNRYQYTDENVLERLFQEGGPIIPSTTLINKRCFSKVGTFDTDLLRAQDTDLWLRIAEKYPIHHIREPLIFRREREGSLGSNLDSKLEYLFRVTEKIASRIPTLKPLVGRRKAMILSGIARQYLEQGKREAAIRASLRALTFRPFKLDALATLLFSLFPLPDRFLKQVLRYARTRLRDN
jgi:glycosyltransferase involved in cell wall biosynthesis